MDENCVSVATTHMNAYRNVDELWQEIFGGPLPDEGLTLEEAEELLDRTGGKYQWQCFLPDATKTAFQNLQEKHTSTHDHVGIALYSRHDNSGHAVNMYDQRHGGLYGVERGVFFRDYQHDKHGAVCTEIKSDTIKAIYVASPDMANWPLDNAMEERKRLLGPPGSEWWFSRTGANSSISDTY
ncbi:hypothetical protein QBC46DRAFT_356724 [Diplogelasinospora grovesii]|uniref:Uncharacterized protein n=1 Tax=Diplogelasinospora grovesii TaxID=303347 RepID=A0AAN6N1K2_9PEZI|nr:hypothetical protein QBC46DRAFT_356724 [Diplogelasinospora grovesii]